MQIRMSSAVLDKIVFTGKAAWQGPSQRLAQKPQFPRDWDIQSASSKLNQTQEQPTSCWLKTCNCSIQDQNTEFQVTAPRMYPGHRPSCSMASTPWLVSFLGEHLRPVSTMRKMVLQIFPVLKLYFGDFKFFTQRNLPIV